MGPHTDSDVMRKGLKEEKAKEAKEAKEGKEGKEGRSTVDIEFSVLPPESPFGHTIAEVR